MQSLTREQIEVIVDNLNGRITEEGHLMAFAVAEALNDNSGWPIGYIDSPPIITIGETDPQGETE